MDLARRRAKRQSPCAGRMPAPASEKRPRARPELTAANRRNPMHERKRLARREKRFARGRGTCAPAAWHLRARGCRPARTALFRWRTGLGTSTRKALSVARKGRWLGISAYFGGARGSEGLRAGGPARHLRSGSGDGHDTEVQDVRKHSGNGLRHDRTRDRRADEVLLAVRIHADRSCPDPARRPRRSSDALRCAGAGPGPSGKRSAQRAVHGRPARRPRAVDRGVASPKCGRGHLHHQRIYTCEAVHRPPTDLSLRCRRPRPRLGDATPLSTARGLRAGRP